MRKSITRYAPLLGILMVAPGALAAQSPRPLREGDRLRVTIADSASAVMGRLVAVDNTTLFLQDAPVKRDRLTVYPPSMNIPVISVLKLEVRHGRSAGGRNAFIGTMLGMFVAGYSAKVYGYRATKNCSCDDPGYGELLAIPVGLLGGVVGGIAGYSLSPVRWDTVPVPQNISRQ